MKSRLVYIILAFVVSCTDDKDITKPYPSVETLAVSNITSQGALFEAKVSNYSGVPSDKGFAWNWVESGHDYAGKESLGTAGDNNAFSAQVSSLDIQTSISVRAYVVVNGVTIYGNPIKFTTLTSAGPTISNFSPKKALVLDTISIFGTGFGLADGKNVVKFDNIVGQAIPVSGTVLKAIVPSSLDRNKSSYNISVTTLGISADAPFPFELDPSSPYKILALDKTRIKLCDTLTLTMSRLPGNPPPLEIYFNNVRTTPYLKNGLLLKVKAPILPVGTTDVTIKFAVLGSEDTFLNTISYDAPVVNSFSPATFTPLTTLTVNGQNLPVCGMTGKINNQPVTLQNVSSTNFTFVVPAGVNAPFDLNLYLQNTQITTYTFE